MLCPTGGRSALSSLSRPAGAQKAEDTSPLGEVVPEALAYQCKDLDLKVSWKQLRGQQVKRPQNGWPCLAECQVWPLGGAFPMHISPRSWCSQPPLPGSAEGFSIHVRKSGRAQIGPSVKGMGTHPQSTTFRFTLSRLPFPRQVRTPDTWQVRPRLHSSNGSNRNLR